MMAKTNYEKYFGCAGAVCSQAIIWRTKPTSVEFIGFYDGEDEEPRFFLSADMFEAWLVSEAKDE